jgi:hypothetical protein
VTLGRVREETLRRGGAWRARHVATTLAATAVLMSAGGPLAAVAHGEAPQWYSNGMKTPTTPGVQVVTAGSLKIEFGPQAAETLTCSGFTLNGSVWNEAGQGVGSEEGFGAAGPCTFPEVEGEMFCGPLPTNCHPIVTTEMPLEEELVEGNICPEGGKLNECKAPGTAELIRHARRPTGNLPWRAELLRGLREEEEANVYRIGVGAEHASCYPTEKAVVEGKEVERAASWQRVPHGCIKLNIVVPAIPLERVVYGTLEPRVLNGVVNGLHPTRLEFGAAAGRLAVSEGELSEGGTMLGAARISGSQAMQLISTR